MAGIRKRGAAGAFFALAALAAAHLIELLPPIDPVMLRTGWTLQAAVAERPTIPDGLQALRGLGRITFARLRTNARKLVQIIDRAVHALIVPPSNPGAFA